MAPHMVLEELSVDFELIKVDRKSNAQHSAEYLALNPLGRIPTLVSGELVQFESPAICIQLAENHNQANLIPAIGDKDRPLFFQWMMYLTNTLQAELMIYFYPDRYNTDKMASVDMLVRQENRITDMLAVLDKELSTRPFLAGDNISVCDHYLFMLCVWADEFKQPPLAFKYLGAYLKKLAKRAAIIKVCQKENLSLSPYQ